MTTLSRSEASRLAELEATIERGQKTFLAVGEALREIHTARLYRTEFTTFEEYCRERWDFTERRGRQLLQAAEIGTTVPVQNERQARELSRLDDGQARLGAWKEATERANREDRSVTASDVRAAVEARRPSAPPKPGPAQVEPPEEPRPITTPEPEPTSHSPADAVETFTQRCTPVPATISAFDIAAAVQGRPDAVDEWRARCSAAREALDELIEALWAESRKYTEAKATAERAGVDLQ